MDENSSQIFEFDEFRFDAERLVLYFRGNVVPQAGEKVLQVLAAVMARPNEVVTHDEILRFAWPEAKYGADKTLVNQYASKLTKLFAQYCPDKAYLRNTRGRGYMFTGKALNRETFAAAQNGTGSTSATEILNHRPLVSGGFRRSWRTLAVIAVLSFAALAAWKLYPVDERPEIERVVRESQMYESLVLYKEPAAFKEEALDKYWIADIEADSNYDRRRIRDSVTKLVAEGRRYGDETKCEQFEFQSVELNADGDFAVVRTLEKWFVAAYFSDGTLQKNRTIGPYFVSYNVRKADGRWLIERSTTARVNRPIPRVSQIEPTTEMVAGKQFFVKISGQDFEDATVHVEVTGPGCPESRPCKVPNSALLEHAKLSETVLDNVPLTLASGTFNITVRNGDSKSSEPLLVTVP